MAAATLEQEMGRRSMAEAMRPIWDRAGASSSSAGGPVTKQMVAEACDTLIREKHLASLPEWPEDIGALVHVDQSWKGETETLREPPPPRRKTPPSEPLPGVATRAMPPSGQVPVSGTHRTPNTLYCGVTVSPIGTVWY